LGWRNALYLIRHAIAAPLAYGTAGAVNLESSETPLPELLKP